MKKDGKMAKIVANVKDAFKINRTIPRACEDIFNACRRVRVVVLGSRGSGKTVFLTSLASNLLNHRLEGCFDLNGWEAFVENVAANSEGDSLKDFPYPQYRESFARGEWPEKTTRETSILRLPLEFRKQGFSSRHVLLEMMDLPGERIADLAMAHKNYKQWCEWMQCQFAGALVDDNDYKDYINKAKKCGAIDGLFKAYKEYLTSSYKKYTTWITPSIVKLTKDGKASGFLEELKDRPLGLSEASQFVPVPIDWLKKDDGHNVLVESFSQAYEDYKKTIVIPVMEWLKEADQLVYLVDVIDILARGPIAQSVEQRFGSEVLSLFSRGRSKYFGGAIWDYLKGMFIPRIKNAYLVATKLDFARSEDSDKLRGLAKQLFGKDLRALKEGIKDENYKACASVVTVKTTKNDAGEEVLSARMSKFEEKPREYSPVEVPEEWPSSDEWEKAIEAETYVPLDTFPLFDKRSNKVPEQRGVDDIVKAILGDILV